MHYITTTENNQAQCQKTANPALQFGGSLSFVVSALMDWVQKLRKNRSNIIARSVASLIPLCSSLFPWMLKCVDL